MSDPAASVYEQLVVLEKARTPFVLVTLVDARGSVPQDRGAKMLVTPSGLHTGTVGGGRVEARAIDEAQSLLAQTGPAAAEPRLVSWTLKGDVGMTCGGAVSLYFEPHPANGAAWTIALFGAGHVAQALVPVLLPLPCRIICYDTRAEWIARLPRAANLQAETRNDLASAVDALPDDTFLISMTQGHKTDRPILQRALGTRSFPFVGVIGSDSKAEILRRELLVEGLDPALAATLHCPLGLPFGTNHPQEIALSIAAQLLTERDRVFGNEKRGRRVVGSGRM